MTDEELIARLRGVTIKQHAYGAYTLVPDPLSSSAADRIEALVGETGELWEAEQRGYANAMEAERKLHEDRIEALVKDLGKAEDRERVADHMAAKYLARAERLEAALTKIKDWPDHRLPSPQDIASEALKGDDHV